MKKAVITGITGMVGSHLADYLLENTDWEVYGLVRWNDKMDNIEHLMPLINNKERVHLLNADINDLASLLTCFEESKPDIFFTDSFWINSLVLSILDIGWLACCSHSSASDVILGVSMRECVLYFVFRYIC